MWLRVSGWYRCRGVEYAPRQLIEVTEDEARFLMQDAPGLFAVEVLSAEVAKPAIDKMVKEPKRRKA